MLKIDRSNKCVNILNSRFTSQLFLELSTMEGGQIRVAITLSPSPSYIGGKCFCVLIFEYKENGYV